MDESPMEQTQEPSPSTEHRLRWAFLVAIGSAFLIGTLGNELRVQDWDPQYTRTAIERTIEYGGTYYENAIINKGPLEPFVYDAASWVTSDDGYWFAISAVSTLLSLLIAWAAGWAARSFGADRWIATLVGIITFLHFSFSPAAYAGVVYVRNLTVVLLAACWVLIVSDPAWSTRRRRVITTLAIAAMAALAVQSLLTSIVSALVLLTATILRVRRRGEPWELLNLAGIGMIAGVVVFLSAPVWYWIRGALDEFWSGWWVYSGYVRSATGSSLASQLGSGWDQIYAYYQDRPLLFGILAAVVISATTGWKGWSRTKRLAYGTVLAWWAAAWFELIITERYSSHYFSVTAVPTALMAALLVGSAASRRARSLAVRHRAAWSVAVIAAALYLSGPGFTDAVGRALEFRGVAAAAREREAQLTGDVRTALAILDLVSHEGDPLLGWTNDPWPYLDLKRVSATRFIWKSFMVGEIYLAPGGGSAYVLPQTWDWFWEDLEESNPMALAQVGHAIAEDTPFATYTSANFAKVYEGAPTSLYLRHEVATELIDPHADGIWSIETQPSSAGGWSVDGNSASYADGDLQREVDLLPIALSCLRIEGTVSWPPDEDPIITFLFEDPTGENERLHIGLDRGRAFSGSDFVLYEETPLGDAGVGMKAFTLVVGGRSAALTMDDTVVAALRLLRPVTVSVQPRAGTVGLSDLLVGDAPVESGC